MDNNLYCKKVVGCWQGKAVGGTLGMVTEGLVGEADLDFYRPVPTELAPNDDLELQVIWGVFLASMENPVVDREFLADAWLKHNRYPCDEYGVATRNLEWGIRPPWSGRFGNYFADGLGAAIRSEIWACLAPGNPRLAADFAREDACIDHDGDGLYAELFCAALESSAFTETNLDFLIDTALGVIPRDSRLARAVLDTVGWVYEFGDRAAVMRRVNEKYGNDNFTDVVLNIPIVVLSLLLGGDDFGKTICTAANCGHDTDCTAATAGAIFGIRFPDLIPEKWLKPIGDRIILSDFIVGLEAPKTIGEFSDLLCGLRGKVRLRREHPQPAPDFSPGEVKWQKGNILWQDFRLDNFQVEHWSPFETSGWCGEIELPEMSKEGILILKTKFFLKEKMPVHVMFNCGAWMRCLVDGVIRFGRDCGTFMMPASHRTAMNQFCELELRAGEHELCVHLGRLYAEQSRASFYFGVARQNSKLWLAEAFHNPNPDTPEPCKSIKGGIPVAS